MSTLRPVGFQSASFSSSSSKTTQPRTTQPQFTGGGQSTQQSEKSPNEQQAEHITKPKPSYKEQLLTGLAYSIGWGITYAENGASYLPNFIQQPIKQRLTKIVKPSLPDPENPKTKKTANHELGHALANLSVGRPMRSLSILPTDDEDGSVSPTFDALTGRENPAAFYQTLIVKMAGFGAELNRATPDELKNKEFSNTMMLAASGDIIKTIRLIQHAQKQGWIKLASTQIPSDMNLKQLEQQLKQFEQKTNLTKEEEKEIQTLFKPIQVCLALPVVQQAIRAAQDIHAVVTPDKREDMVRLITSKVYLEQDELYFLLANFVSKDELKRMQAIQERFTKVQDRTIPSHLARSGILKKSRTR